MIVKVGNNRRVIPIKIDISNQFENDTRFLEFDISDIEFKGNVYLICKHETESDFYTPLLLENNAITIKTFMSQKSGRYDCHIIVTTTEIDEDYDFSQDNPMFISDGFYLYVMPNYLTGSSKAWDVTPTMSMKFEELLALINRVKDDLENGAFNGKDGKDGKDGAQGEKGEPGRDGDNGKSAYQLALDNGFEGSEQEWLESLKYQHSQEFTDLANQVMGNAQKAQESQEQSKLSETKAKEYADSSKANADKVASEVAKVEQTVTQVETNTNDILSFAIKNQASGNPCVVNDSSDKDIQNLNIYGESWQNTSIDIFDGSDIRKGFVDNSINIGQQLAIKNSNVTKTYVKCAKVTKGETYTIEYEWSSLLNSSIRKAAIVDDSEKILEKDIVCFNNSKRITIIPNTDGWLCISVDKNVTSVKIIVTENPSPSTPIPIVSKLVQKIEISDSAVVKQIVNLSQPITLRGIQVSSGGNVTIDGKQYASDVITEKDGIIGVERNIGNIDSYTDEEVGDIYMSSMGELVPTSHVIYKLNTPIFEPLPQEDHDKIKSLKLYYPNTTINTNAFTKVTYIADTKLYIDNLVRQLHTNLQTQLQKQAMTINNVEREVVKNV